MATEVISVSSLATQVGLSNVLYLRQKASEMFEISLQQYRTPLIGDVYVCDMRGIEDCSGSFVDEFIHRWFRLIRSIDNTLFVLRNVSEDVLYTITSSLNLRNNMDKDSMVLLVFDENRFQAIGDKMEKNVRDVFDLMAEGMPITARLVADKFAIELNSAGNRLKKLYDAHLAMRCEQSIEAGGKYQYYLPVIK